MALSGSTIASTFLKLLRMNSDTMGADATASYIQDSADTDSALSISTTRVGIGTSAPDSALEISKDVDGEFVALKLTNEDAAGSNAEVTIAFDLEDTGGTAVDAAKIKVFKKQAFADSATQDGMMQIALSKNGTLPEAMRIDGETGFVGIGATLPDHLLTVSGGGIRTHGSTGTSYDPYIIFSYVH